MELTPPDVVLHFVWREFTGDAVSHLLKALSLFDATQASVNAMSFFNGHLEFIVCFNGTIKKT
jgi:hypothetical protein